MHAGSATALVPTLAFKRPAVVEPPDQNRTSAQADIAPSARVLTKGLNGVPLISG